MRINRFGLIVLCFLSACNNKQTNISHLDEASGYFSLADYFNREGQRLSAQEPEIRKTVLIDEKAETKTVIIRNWQHELALFAEADINKAAWKSSYTIDSTAYRVVYECIDPQLKTQKIVIEYGSGGQVEAIRIHNQASNWIYQSVEKLIYFPDSLYEIEKTQDIRIVGKNNYRIRGEFVKTPL